VKWARVNSVFLVQLRKRLAADFRGSSRIKQQLKCRSFERWMAAVFVLARRGERNLAEWAAVISTEGAQEMQKGKVSSGGLPRWVFVFFSRGL
jgi:hypothetical protein